MNTKTAAEKIQVSVSTIRRWCRTGRIQAVKVGRVWTIDPASLPIQKENSMIKQVVSEKTTKTWRGETTEIVTRWHIEGTVTAITAEKTGFGGVPVLTIASGDQSATVIGDLGGALYKPQMLPVRVGDQVRVIAGEQLLPGGQYQAYEIEQL